MHEITQISHTKRRFDVSISLSVRRIVLVKQMASLLRERTVGIQAVLKASQLCQSVFKQLVKGINIST